MNEHIPIPAENARALERSLEVVVYYVTVLSLLLSYLPLGVTVNHTLFNIAAILTVIGGVIAYRILPVQGFGPGLRYTFELKSFAVIVMDIILAGLVVGATGGGDSPFILLYAFLVMASALLLHSIHLYILIPVTLISLVIAECIAHPTDLISPRILVSSVLLCMMYWIGLIIIKRRARHA